MKIVTTSKFEVMTSRGKIQIYKAQLKALKETLMDLSHNDLVLLIAILDALVEDLDTAESPF